MKTVSFLGVGNMAAAMLHGILAGGLGLTPADITVFDVNPSQYEKIAGIGLNIAPTASAAIMASDVTVLAIKPQNYRELLGSIGAAGIDLSGKTFISLGAGISTDSICRMLGCDAAIVRVMPNTPLQIGKGVTALCRNASVSDEAFSFACGIFACAGSILPLDESQMNTVICVNGSSPAYIYHIIDAMIQSARAQGLDCEGIKEAVCQSVIGAAEMLLRSELSAGELVRIVTSPKGTTERAMNVLYEEDIAGTIDRAMRACTERAEEMARDFG